MSKKIAVMQPYFFPYIGYFQLMNCVDTFVVLDDVNFINKGWINRNNILINSKQALFTIPLNKSSQNKLIKDTEVSYTTCWTDKFLKTLEVSYSKAPYFEETFNIISDLLKIKEKKISALIMKSFEIFKKDFDIAAELIFSSEKFADINLTGEQRIIEICKLTNSTQYINPIGGEKLYSREKFDEEKIKLNFLKTREIRYKQFNNNFVDSLSIIDLMMFNSKLKVKEYLNDYGLI